MVKIRLARIGAKKSPFYRIVVADAKTPRNGRSIAELGYYDPTKNPTVLKIDVAEAQKWLKTGAVPTDKAKSLLIKAGAYE